jgi:hypothetical protein
VKLKRIITFTKKKKDQIENIIPFKKLKIKQNIILINRFFMGMTTMI